MRFLGTTSFVCLALLASCGNAAKQEQNSEPKVADEVSPLSNILKSKLDRYRDSDPRETPLPAALEDADLAMVQGLLSTLCGSNARYADLAKQDLEGLALSGLRPLLACLETAQQNEEETIRERWFVARTLGLIDHPKAVLELLELAKTDPSSDVRSMAIYQLGESPQKPDWILPHLCLRLKYEKDAECHRLLGQVLAGLENYSFLRAWFELTRSADASKANPIFEAIGVLESQTGQSATELAKAWSQPGSLDPRTPSDALLHEVWYFVSELSGAHFQLRGVDDARFALSDLGPWLATELSPALADSDVYVRLHVGQVFERLGPRAISAVPALIAALDNAELGAQATASLASIGDRRALAPLLEAASDRSLLDLRSAAVRALGRTAWDESVDTLRTALSDSQIPGQEDLEVLAYAALLQVNPTPDTFDSLLHFLTKQNVSSGAAELAFADALKRLAKINSASEQAIADWQEWNAMGSSFGSRPSAKGLTKRRSSRGHWLLANRHRLLASLSEG